MERIKLFKIGLGIILYLGEIMEICTYVVLYFISGFRFFLFKNVSIYRVYV